MTNRISKLQDWMKKEQIQMAFLTSTENIFYLSNFYSDPHERLLGIAVFQEEEPFIICPAMEMEEAKNAGWTSEIIGYSDIEDPFELLFQSAGKRVKKFEKIAVEKEHLNVSRFETLIKHFPEAAFVSAEEKLRELRMIKNEKELALIRKACSLADYGVKAGVAAIKEGKTELEIVAEIEYELKKKGVSQMSFSTMVLAGKNGASPHGVPGQTKINKGDFVLFDLGVVVEGYCSDITRTVAFGDIDEKQKEIYDTVLKAQTAAIEKAKQGMPCSEVDLAARTIIQQSGYGKYFPHRLGHGLGISVHEFPSITETNNLSLTKGMVFTIEPGIYVPGIAGVRIEDDVAVLDEGVEVLTKYPKELQVV